MTQQKTSEKTLERKLNERVRQIGGMSIKLHGAVQGGLPDRLILIKGVSLFVELKTTGEKLRPLQVEMHRRIRETGHKTYIIDSQETLNEFIQYAQSL